MKRAAAQARIVEYVAGCRSHAWRGDGRVLLCISGVLRTRFADGRLLVVGPGGRVCVDERERPIESWSETGAMVVIVE